MVRDQFPPPPSLPYCCVWKIKHWKNSCGDIPLPPNVFPWVERGGEGRGDVGYLSRSFNNSNVFLDDITRGFKRRRRGGGDFTLFTRPSYTDFEHFGSTDHLLHNQGNMYTKNAQIVSKSPSKHHMILADVLPNAGEEIIGDISNSTPNSNHISFGQKFMYCI